MNAAQLHLMLAHLPLSAALFATVLFLVSMIRRSDTHFRTAAWTLLIGCLLGVLVFASGPRALELLKTFMEPSREIADEHALLGQLAFASMVLTGLLSTVALRQFSGDAGPSKLLRRALLFLSLALALLLSITAHEGGEIRHDEIRSSIEGRDVSNV
ncbi:MAG: hypothetical protein QGG80_07425 [Candidatus Krumholzibacteria bacterium]|jgi:uncharacterized membrane protein|nr:hypothetical protein [Candidatus Krumholzibacteria bacterium]